MNLDDDSYKQTLGQYSGCLFDVCLFWDLLHCLEPTQLGALNEALKPYLYSATLGHSICHICGGKSGKDAAWDYRIAAIGQLELIQSTPKQYRPWSQHEFVSLFDSFSIKEDVLSRDGSLELLLQAD